MKNHVVLVFLAHLAYGMNFSMFGPIVPYLAEESGRLESDFTFVFVLRGISYLMAGLCQQRFFKQYHLTKRMMASCIISGICLVLFRHFY